MNRLHTLDNTLIQLDPMFNSFQDELELLGCQKGDHLLLSISGGMDSMAMLSLCASIDQYSFSAAHVNHQLRDESKLDEQLVKQVCDSLNIPFYVKTIDPLSLQKGESVEAWGREHRYRFLSEISMSIEANWVMTAHHSNDQAETILLNLSRKSGITGLRGIAKKNRQILRPFLKFNKSEIEHFVNKHNIPYHDDETNYDTTIPRNFIRHSILSKWEKTSPNIISSLSSSANHFKEWQDALDFLVIKELVPKVNQSDNQFDVPIEWFKTLPKMAKIRLAQILTESEQSIQWSKHDIELLYQFFNKNVVGHQIHLKNGWSLLWDRDQILGQKKCLISDEEAVELNPNSSVKFNQYRYELKIQNTIQQNVDDESEQVDWSKLVGSKLEIRHWKEGDSFQPLGMKGHQKISDFLINKKVDRFSKQDQTVMTSNGDIVWVCGQRIADWVKITQQTTETAVINRQLINS